MRANKENGYVLVVVLLLLLVLTVIGLTALGTSSVENMLSGNIRLRTSNVARADGATEISTAVITRALRVQDTVGFSNIVSDPALPNELRSFPFDPDTVDITYQVGGQNVNVDIDKMYQVPIGGQGNQFASGYDGIGTGSAQGMYYIYRINPTSRDLASSQGSVGAIYRHIPVN